MEPFEWSRRLQRGAWLPVPLLLLIMAVLWGVGADVAYELPYLFTTLNVLFMLPAALAMAYQAGRGFLLRGNIGLLWLSCGMLFWGSAGLMGGILVAYGPGVVITVHNILIWLAAACHLAGMIFAPRQRAVIHWPELWLTGAGVGALTVVMTVVQTAVAGDLPTFFIQGEGGTFLRQIVLSSAIGMLMLAAFLLIRNRYETVSGFQYWYALALLLVAVGLLGVMIQPSFGSLLGWTGRIAQYLGSIYLLVAAVTGLRETRNWGHPLAVALGEAKQQFHTLLDLALDGVTLRELTDENNEGRFLRVNPAICALLGYTAQELCALTPSDITASEDREKLIEEVDLLRRDGKLRHEKTLLAKNGDRIPVEISTRRYWHRGRLMGLSVIRDMSQHKRAEAILRENERFKQAILDGLTAHIAMLDQEGRIVAVNAPWRRYALENSAPGQSVSGTDIGVNYLAVCRAALGDSAEGALSVHRGIQAVLAGRMETFSMEYACHSPTERRWFTLNVTGLNGGRDGAVVAHNDITAPRRLAEDLRIERDRFNRIAATVPGAICSFELAPNGRTHFPYSSPAVKDLYGLDPEALAVSAAPLWAMIHPEDRALLDASIAASASSMTPWRDEYRLRHPNKGEIWMEGHFVPAREPNGVILWHGYVQDITERKRAEATLRALLQEKEALLREVHHRVKNNLAAIIDLLELQRTNENSAPTGSLLAEAIHRIRAMALIHAMLYQSEHLSRVEFSSYLQALVAYLREAFDPSGVIQLDVTASTIWMNLDTAIPCGLIVNELVTNAYKYAFPTPRRQPGTEACRIAVTAQSDGVGYTLSIADNGVGLPAELDWTTTHTLGLRLVRMLGQHQLCGQLALDGTGGTFFMLRFGANRRIESEPHER